MKNKNILIYLKKKFAIKKFLLLKKRLKKKLQKQTKNKNAPPKPRRVSDKTLFEGSELCFRKAEDLFSLAKVAHKRCKYNISSSLSILAMEEIAKGESMLFMISETNLWSWYTFWELFSGRKSHIRKLELSKGLLNWYKNPLSMVDKYGEQKKEAEQENLFKQSGFYINFNKETREFVDTKVGKKESENRISKLEILFNTIGHYRNFNLQSWSDIIKTAKEHMPPNIDFVIADMVYKSRKGSK